MKPPPASRKAFPGLDPGIDGLLEILATGNPPPPEPSPIAIAKMREAASQVRLTWADSVPEGPVRRHVVETPNGPVPLAIHLPARVPPGGTLLFLHGGGWTLFDSVTHSPLMRALAAKTGGRWSDWNIPARPRRPTRNPSKPAPT